MLLRDVVNPDFPLRHDPDKLAAELLAFAKDDPARAAEPERAAENGHQAPNMRRGHVGGELVVGASARMQASRSKKGD